MSFYGRVMAFFRKWLSGLSVVQWGVAFFFGSIPLLLAWMQESAVSNPLVLGIFFFVLAIASIGAINR
jgi:hypothetical protein